MTKFERVVGITEIGTSCNVGIECIDDVEEIGADNGGKESMNVEATRLARVEEVSTDEYLCEEIASSLKMSPASDKRNDLVTNIRFPEFLARLELAESDLNARREFVDNLPRIISQNTPDLTFILHKLLQRGYLDEQLLNSIDFLNWDMSKFNQKVVQVMLKHIFVHNKFENSTDFSSFLLELKLNKQFLKQFVNFYAIRNMNLSLLNVHTCVLVCKELQILNELMDNLLLVWIDPAFVDAGSEEYHIRIAASIASTMNNAELEPKRFVSKFIRGVPLYLEASRSTIRTLGMVLADMMAANFTPDAKLNLLPNVPSDLDWLLKQRTKHSISREVVPAAVVEMKIESLNSAFETKLAIRSEEFVPIAANDTKPRYFVFKKDIYCPASKC